MPNAILIVVLLAVSFSNLLPVQMTVTILVEPLAPPARIDAVSCYVAVVRHFVYAKLKMLYSPKRTFSASAKNIKQTCQPRTLLNRHCAVSILGNLYRTERRPRACTHVEPRNFQATYKYIPFFIFDNTFASHKISGTTFVTVICAHFMCAYDGRFTICRLTARDVRLSHARLSELAVSSAILRKFSNNENADKER
ncbi:hypothetical protein EVAR_21438_1 [Eumeta japonica]|uniref:Secreted protein n=1 Tax=Eumeta variegata TaxID=151549 RepID=A0A4C1VGY2_EUMVA|nr:hypothetical protein EVAR_21438_1 [Eumeta japonica]